MNTEIITQEQFQAVIETIPGDAQGMGFDLKSVYYSYRREESGVVKGEPYLKPAYIQISPKQKRFRIESVDQRLKFLYDPSGEFNFIPIPEGEDFLELIDHFRKMENRLRIITAAPGTITVSVDIKHLRALINALLSWFDFNKSQKKDVQKAVETALKKPYQYLEDHKEQLANRDIGEPVHNLFIIALVDAMQKLGAAVEVDWNTDFETVVWQVSGLAIPCKITSPQESKAPPLLVPDILRRLGKEIMAQGATLTTIDIDTDSYVLTVVPSTRYERVVELAKKAGIKVDRF